MPKNFFKRYLPAAQKIKEHKHLQIFGKLLHSSNLWHLNRYSVTMACSIGIFCAFMPIPFQMVLAAALAIIFSANLPISVVLVWISNPLTMPPIFYFTYKIGTLILDLPPKISQSSVSLQWFFGELQHIWKPLFLGSFICGIVAALLANIIMRFIWRITVLRSWHKRKQTRTRTTS